MKKNSLFITFMIVSFYMQAQQLTPSVICSASGTLSNGTTNVYWTIGETIVETINFRMVFSKQIILSRR